MQPNEQLKSMAKIQKALNVDYLTVRDAVNHEKYLPPKFQSCKTGSVIRYYESEVREFLALMGQWEKENSTEAEIDESIITDTTGFNDQDRYYYRVERGGKMLDEFTFSPTSKVLLNRFGEGEYIINKIDLRKNGMVAFTEKIAVSELDEKPTSSNDTRPVIEGNSTASGASAISYGVSNNVKIFAPAAITDWKIL